MNSIILVRRNNEFQFSVWWGLLLLVTFCVSRRMTMNSGIFKHVDISRYLGATERGGSSSQFMASEDGTQYIIKVKENPQGIRVLVNELIANGIARRLELPCPKGVIAKISEALLRILHLNIGHGRQVSPGLHFGIERIPNCYRQPPRDLIKSVSNQDKFPGIILFDILTYNKNRNNQGNYLIQHSEQNRVEFYIIDHGHCFNGPNWNISITDKIGSWNVNALPEVRECIRGTDPFRVYIEKIMSLSDNFFSDIVNEVPDEWNVTPEEREALKSFLRGQRDRIEEIILQHKNLFPNWN